MAARTVTPNHKAEVRERIKVSQLLNRLHENALAKTDVMTPGQIRSAEILLKKALPDLSTVTHEGNDEKPLVGIIKRVVVRPGDPNG
jgi:hypothetical protein